MVFLFLPLSLSKKNKKNHVSRRPETLQEVDRMYSWHSDCKEVKRISRKNFSQKPKSVVVIHQETMDRINNHSDEV